MEQEGGTFSCLRINLGYGEEVGSKFGSFQRLIDVVPHVKTVEKLLLIFKNMMKSYEEFRDSRPHGGNPKMHGYIGKENFLIHYPSYEVKLLFPLEDCSKTDSSKPAKQYRSPEYEKTKTMSVA